jgi:hypothetical protein
MSTPSERSGTRSTDSSPSAPGLRKLRAGQVAIAQARMAHTLGTPDAESKARQALATLRSALDHLDDLPEQLDAHLALDAAGLWVRKTFGCTLHQDERGYHQTCPVALGHQRWGSSIGTRDSVAICMICGQDARLCRSHVAGRQYRAPVKRIHDYCNVCGITDPCDHAEGTIMDISCWRLVTKVDLLEVSVVSRPAQPDARITSVDVPTSEIAEALGSQGWEPGMPVDCDRCLQPCGGLLELPRRPGAVD